MKRVGLLAGAATLTLTGGSIADTTTDATNEALRTRIAELESRLAAVEAQDNEDWLTEQRAEQIKGLVQDVLADADTRSSLLAQGMTAGYDDGAVLASADGNWLLRTNILLQTRFALSNADSQVGEDTVWGFQVTRAKFILTGNVVSPEWFYKLEIETSGNAAGTVTSRAGLARTDTRAGLEDAYIGYDFGNGWKVLGGTMKAPLLYEELVDSRYQQAVERSLVNYIHTGGRTDGLAVDYRGDQFHVVGMWNNGINDGLYAGLVPGGPSAALATDTDFAVTVRGEWLAMGTWEQFMDYTSPRGEETGILVGGAVHYQTPQGTLPSVDLTVLTIDTSLEFGGWNVYGAFIYANGDATPSVDSIAVVIGGGWYMTEDWELFGRYEYLDPDGLGGVTQTMNNITLGVTKYFAGHNAKWVTDIGVAADEVGFSNTVTGWRVDTLGEDGQVLIRSQLQIVF